MAVRQKIKFTFLRSPAENEKLAPQAREILNILQEAPEQTLMKPDLVAQMETRVVTRQDQSRILAFYQAGMIAAGLIRMDKLGPTDEEIKAMADAKADRRDQAEKAKASKVRAPK